MVISPTSPRPRWKAWLDVAVVVGVYAYNFPVAAGTLPESMPLVAAALLFAGECLPFLWRRRFPQAVFWVTLGFALGHVVLGVPVAVADVMVLLALCSLTACAHWKVTLLPLVSTIVWGLVAVWGQFRAGYLTIGEVGLVVVVTLLLYSWAVVLNVYCQHIAELQRGRHARDVMIMEQERKRIARELHDVVSHGLSSVVALSDGAAHTVGSDPEQARKAMLLVGETGREALAEMRTILYLLRSESQGSVEPQPGVADLGRLLDTARSTGLDVTFGMRGDFTDLGPGLQLTIFRLVQECLTNARKHADSGATVVVDLKRTSSEVQLKVRNPISARRYSKQTNNKQTNSKQTNNKQGNNDPGHGLVGMRERVRTYGGTLDTAVSGDAFQVSAIIPVGSRL